MTYTRKHLPAPLALLFMASFSSLAAQPRVNGECPNYSADLGGPTAWIYAGNFSTVPARMLIRYDDAQKKVIGEYGFSGVRSTQQVVGYITEAGKRLQLQVRDNSGTVIGSLNLVFGPPKGMTNHDDCVYLTGEEHLNNRSENHTVSLGRLNPVAIKDNVFRKQNEKVAFEIQESLQFDDKKRFASLIKYPISVNHVGGSRTLYESPASVIKNYQSIVSQSKPSILTAVPHELETFGSSSRFADGEMCLSYGKISEICDDGCKCPQIY